MPPKTGAVNTVLEQAERIASDAWEKTGEGAKTVAKAIAAQTSFSTWLGLEEPPSDEVVKAKEDEELMRKTEGYKEIFRKIDAIEGRTTDEKVLDEKVRRYIEEERKRATESFHEMRTEGKTEADKLGTTPQSEQQQAQEERQKEIAEEEEAKRKKAEEQARLENVVEAPPGKQTGLSFKGRRKSNPRRGTPRATAKLRSAESKLGQGVGG